MQFKDLRIGTRLVLGFGGLLLLAAVTATGIWRLKNVGELGNRIAADGIDRARLILQWQGGVELAVSRVIASAKNSDLAEQSYFQGLVSESVTINSALQKRVEQLVDDDEGKLIVRRIGEHRAQAKRLTESIIKAKTDGDHAQAKKLVQESLVPVTRAYLDEMKMLTSQQGALIDRMVADVNLHEASGRRAMLLLGGLALALGSVSAYLLTLSIVRPLRVAVETVNRVAHGDLTGRIEASSSDEIGQLMHSLGQMNGNLHSIVTEVRGSTETIANASREIAGGNMDLSSRTESQAGSLEETASAMEELTSTVKQNADSALRASRLAADASEIAQRGGTAVGQVVDTMTAINDASKKIVNIIGVIDGIAFQTNILALNAAVEAARAGEQGRGFAVVAGEVRTLAQRAAGAAREIKSLIDDSVSKVDLGSRLVSTAGETMNEVVTSIRRVTEIVHGISLAGSEQTAGIEQINESVMHMDATTQQNAALVEQAAAAACSLEEQAANLTRLVSAFTIRSAAQACDVRLDASRRAVLPLPRLRVGAIS